MTTTITAPVEGFDGIVAGVRFTNGVGECDSPAVLPYFRRHGYTVAAAAALEIPEGDPSDAWTVVQLRAHAAANGVDLGDAKKKDEILQALDAAKSEEPPAS